MTAPTSTCQLQAAALLEATEAGIRLDGRKLIEARSLQFSLPKNQNGHVTVALGKTRVSAAIHLEVSKPPEDRPSEGIVAFRTSFPSLSSRKLKQEDVEYQNHLYRMIEAVFREGSVVDTESLCIITGKQVWTLSVYLTVLNDEGNLLDCGIMAVNLALLLFRRPAVSVSGQDIKIHSLEEKVPLPLTLHHLPLSVTFAQLSDSNYVLDPSSSEEYFSKGSISIVADPATEEICYLYKKGVATDKDIYGLCLDHAQHQAFTWAMEIKKALS